ncbi:MAG TPA: TlpA disulfide reductase family protein [Thermoanaerobaculia bacterium]|nr:TlpA disulfide reductase family protein [Thermoanaerobaculia bacterium]
MSAVGWRHALVVLGLAAVLAGAAALGWWVARVTVARPAAGGLAGDQLSLDPEAKNRLLATFRLPTLDGRTLGPADYRGQVVVLDFWTTWCGPCRAQSKILAGLQQEYAGRGLVVLGVNLAEPDEVVESFLAEQPAEWPTLLDRDGSLSLQAEVFGLPTMVILDRSGSVVYRGSGLTGARALRAVIDQALGESPQGTR